MLLYDKIGIPPYLGAVTASIIGYSLSIIITLVSLKKQCKMNYGSTIKVLLKMLVPTILMMMVVFAISLFISVLILSSLRVTKRLTSISSLPIILSAYLCFAWADMLYSILSSVTPKFFTS